MLPEKKQVLIVDDEPNLRKILSAQLSRDGYDVLTAEDGEKGLAALREHHIDLVITDLKMPKIDGMTLLREALREELSGPRLERAIGVVYRPERELQSHYFQARLPEQFRSLGSLEFSKLLLTDARVAVSPGIGFGEYGDGHVRFSLIENEERTRQALRGVKMMLAGKVYA